MKMTEQRTSASKKKNPAITVVSGKKYKSYPKEHYKDTDLLSSLEEKRVASEQDTCITRSKIVDDQDSSVFCSFSPQAKYSLRNLKNILCDAIPLSDSHHNCGSDTERDNTSKSIAHASRDKAQNVAHAACHPYVTVTTDCDRKNKVRKLKARIINGELKGGNIEVRHIEKLKARINDELRAGNIEVLQIASQEYIDFLLKQMEQLEEEAEAKSKICRTASANHKLVVKEVSNHVAYDCYLSLQSLMMPS